MQARADVVLSHLSALAEWDVPLWETPLHEVHITRLDRKCGRREVGVRQHLGALRDGDVMDFNGIRVTSPTRTGLDSLTILDVEHGLTAINDLLHRGLTTLAELRACRTYMERWPNTLKQDLVLRLADGRCESVGESRTLFLCWRQGLPRPVPQYVLRDAAGVEIARVDFAWPDLKLFLEFDGRVKYQKLVKPGESATDVVLREKRREEMICELTGWRCIRVSWADLYRPELVAARIRKLFQPAAVAG